ELGLLLLRRERPYAAYRELSAAARLGSEGGRRELFDLTRRRQLSRALAEAETAAPPVELGAALLADLDAHLRGAMEELPGDELAARLLEAREVPVWAAATRAPRSARRCRRSTARRRRRACCWRSRPRWPATPPRAASWRGRRTGST